MTAWALSSAVNPAVLRLDTSEELTTATIETCPPSMPPAPLDRLLGITAIRSIDLHRYRARINLRPSSRRETVAEAVEELLSEEWGGPSVTLENPVRVFSVPYNGRRLVAESLEMAGEQPILRRLFDVPGVVEAVLEPGRVSVRIASLFSWSEVDTVVRSALEAE